MLKRTAVTLGNDLLDQMCRGLSKFAGVTPISFALVAAMILGYIVLIAPGDSTWSRSGYEAHGDGPGSRFRLWVVLVSAGAYALAMYTKGNQLRLNQVDRVDVDVESRAGRKERATLQC